MRESLQNVEILVADRDDHLRSALELLLTNDHHNINITEASDLDSLVQFMDLKKYNLVIMDWNLHRNGVNELISKYRDKQPFLIIIILSMRLEDKTAALNAGADAFVYKGDPPEYLHNTLLTYLEKASKTTDNLHSAIPSCPRPIYCNFLV